MLMPKRTKFRKMQKGRVKGLAQRGARITFGDYGIKALEPGWITSRQIEAARIAMTRYMKRAGKVWIRVFPDKPITKKPAETRMGKGKGSPEYWVAVVKPGRILFELGGVDEELAREAMRLAIQKLPIKAKFVVRPEAKPVPLPGGDGASADDNVAEVTPSEPDAQPQEAVEVEAEVERPVEENASESAEENAGPNPQNAGDETTDQANENAADDSDEEPAA